jgi:hypothetical protein
MSNRLTFILCAMLVLVFGALGRFSASKHSPTIDEPICALAGYVQVHDGDFRFDADNPPLWKYWAMIPNLRVTLLPATTRAAGGSGGEGFVAATRRLFQTPGNDGDAFVQRGRDMMLLLGMALAAAIAAWAWRIAGSIGAITACALFCFDPNFLAHAPLFKADVVVALLMVCTAFATWSVGRRAAVANLAALCLLCGAAATVKYNALIAPLLAGLLLAGRALVPAPWSAFGRDLTSRAARLGLLLAISLAMILVTAAVIWACYDFRYQPTRTDGVMLDIDAQVREAKDAPTVAATVQFLDRHHLLPQAWLFGVISIYNSSTTNVVRQSYLMDQVSPRGWWYYFPVAMLAKTPLATLAALLLAAATVGSASLRRADPRTDRWTIACLAVPPILYAVAAMAGNANVGIRHVLPLYPPMYVGAGIMAARLRSLRPRLFAGVAALLGAGLAVEAMATFPHEISFFNAIARPHRLYLLSDSNLDWGQDLKSIAAWQRQHPDVRLYLGYWGTVDPAFFGIRYQHIPGGFPPAADVAPTMLSPANEPGVLMISATLLQGVNYPPQVRAYPPYVLLRQLPPRQILGDATYVYDWPPRP